MSDYPISAVCPDCGSSEAVWNKRSTAAHRVCRQCGAEYLRPTPFGRRIFFALLLFLPGLGFAGLAAYLGVELMEAEAGDRAAGT
jgi:rubredoxin